MINEKYNKRYFEFDEKKQQIKLARWSRRSELPEELAQFVKEDSTFDCTKYFQVFVEELHQVIQENSIKLPEGLTLSVKYTPCDICRSEEDVTPQYVRCRHEPDCEEHKKVREDSNYKEKCQCKVYNLPSLTFSKIGIVLHLLFKEDGEPFIIDVDINPPTIPVENVKNFSGSNKMKRLWLRKNRRTIRNWRAEWRKTHDMSAAGKVKVKGKNGRLVRVGKRSVRLRLVNRKLVIPEQVSLSNFTPKNLSR